MQLVSGIYWKDYYQTKIFIFNRFVNISDSKLFAMHLVVKNKNRHNLHVSTTTFCSLHRLHSYLRGPPFPDESLHTEKHVPFTIGRHIEWEVAKHLLAQMERPIPSSLSGLIFRSDFGIPFECFQTKLEILRWRNFI